ncbi:Gfo/Idh/MocA family protein [Arthrobacter sp. NPDC058130]|uniref:Gfo/Idh/MocA family protein n=1 Tax=Arthrobacter sp. NPDC058130 TaxID=3346353 RepID=UPI0036EA4B69
MTLPNARLTDPASIPALKWGVIGTGWIATRFARAAHLHTSQKVVAVAARDSKRTAAFASTYGVDRTYATPEALLADPQIDVVYVATPHSSHRNLALLAIAAGKHLLIEKPIATSAAEAQEIVDAARAAGVFVMEAMWTRYLPQMDILRQLIEGDELGKIHHVSADFGVLSPYDAEGRMWNPALAGGALLDLGVYPISFVSAILGKPHRVQATGIATANGIDLRATALMGYEDGVDAVAATSMISKTSTRAAVVGSKARVDIPSSFFTPTGLVLSKHVDGIDTTETFRDEAFEEGYDALSYQINALAQYVGEGRPESPLHSLDETVSVLATIDEIRTLLSVVDYTPTA